MLEGTKSSRFDLADVMPAVSKLASPALRNAVLRTWSASLAHSPYESLAVSPQAPHMPGRSLILHVNEVNKDMQATGELVELLRDSPNDSRIKKRIGRHFLRVGSPSHAVQVFQELIELHPRDGEAYAGVGEAEFALDH